MLVAWRPSAPVQLRRTVHLFGLDEHFAERRCLRIICRGSFLPQSLEEILRDVDRLSFWYTKVDVCIDRVDIYGTIIIMQVLEKGGTHMFEFTSDSTSF